jgi:hypothetical protein
MDSEQKKVAFYSFPHEREDLTLHVRPTANAWWKDLKKVGLLLDAFDNHCSPIGEACYVAGITRRQYKYFAQKHPVLYERRRRAKFAKREREIEEKSAMYGYRMENGSIKSAFQLLTFTEPGQFDLRYRSDYARLCRIHGPPAPTFHPPPPKSEEEKRRDMLAEVEKTRIMLGHPSDPKHYAMCQECEHLLLPPSEWPEPYRSSYFQSMPQGPTQPGHTTAV